MKVNIASLGETLTSKTKFAMGLSNANDLTKHGCRNNVHL